MPSSTPGMLGQLLQRLGQTRLGDRQPLAHLDRRRLVVHADELKFHDWTNL